MPEAPRPGRVPGRIGANSAEGFHFCISQLHCMVWRTHPYGALVLSRSPPTAQIYVCITGRFSRHKDVIKTSSAKGKGCHGHQAGVMVCVPRRNVCSFRPGLPHPGVRQNTFISKTDESTAEFPKNMVMRENLSKQQSSKETGAKTATAF